MSWRVGFRHCDPRFGFLWLTAAQPEARWHAAGEGPANYFADTPTGAWDEPSIVPREALPRANSRIDSSRL